MERNDILEMGKIVVDFLGEVEKDIGELRKDLQEVISSELKPKELDESEELEKEEDDAAQEENDDIK